ncbi:retrovirus-related pol polyprotein from transposon TNT 1-94, partial [Tanacetum coccineum]
KKFQDELEKQHDVNYMSKVELDCAKAKMDLMSFKMESQKLLNDYTPKINDLNQTISEMKKKLFAHQETIFIMSQEKEAQTKFHKTREDKELEKIIALENKIKALDDIVYKTGQLVQTMNMLNRNCRTSFVKPEFLQRANPRLYDIGCYNDNLALMFAPESDKTIHLAQERFNQTLLNKINRLSREYYYADHMNAILGVYTTLDEFTDLQCDYVDQVVKCERLEKELSKSNITSKSFEALQQHAIDLELALQQCQEQIKNDKAFKENQSKVFLKEREQYFEIQDLKAQLQDKGIAISELKKLIEKMKGKSVETKFEKPSVIRQPNAFKSQRQLVLGKQTTFSDSLAKTDFSKSKSVTTINVSNDFLKPVTAHILPQNVKSILKNTNVIALGMYKVHTKPNQTRTSQFPLDIRKTNKCVSFSTEVISTTSVSRPQLKSNQLEDRVMHNNSQGKKQQIEDYHRNFKFSNNKTSVTACNDSLNAKTSNVNFVCVTCGKCVLNDNYDMCVLHYINDVNSRTKMPMAVPISTRKPIRTLVEIILFIVDSGCSKHMTGNLKLLSNFVEQFLGMVKFRNDQIAPILGYGDLVQGNVTIKRVYYVEGLNHNLLSVGHYVLLAQICTPSLFKTHLHPIQICLMAKASSSQAWLWRRRLSHLNFDTINLLSKYDIVTGLTLLILCQDHLCSSCELGKAKRKSFKD